MFDLPLPIHPTAHARGIPPHFPSGEADPSHPFALTLSRRAPADLMSGRAAPLAPVARTRSEPSCVSCTCEKSATTSGCR